MKIKLFKVKKGMLPTLLAWGHYLETKVRTEALETLKEERVTREALGTFTLGEETYAFGFMEGECLPAKDSELNRQHRKVMKECLEFETFGESLYDLEIE